jgi:hypothetical protein
MELEVGRRAVLDELTCEVDAVKSRLPASGLVHGQLQEQPVAFALGQRLNDALSEWRQRD